MKDLQSSLQKKTLYKPKPVSLNLDIIQQGLIFTVAVIILTSVVGYRFYYQPKLGVGTRSPETIKAPADGKFIDDKKTNRKRQEIRTGINPILRRNPEQTREIKENLDTLLEQIEVLRQLAGTIPFVSPQILSTPTQEYLRSISDSEWQEIQRLLKANSSQKNRVNYPEKPFKKVLIELDKYRQKVSDSQFGYLLFKINQFRQQYQQSLRIIGQKNPQEISLDNTLYLIKIPEPNWQHIKETMENELEEILLQGLPIGLTDEHLKEMINIKLEHDKISSQIQPMIDELLINIVRDRSNLEIDKEATATRAEEAAKAMDPLYVEVKKGEIIVKVGETISQEKFVLLDNFRLSRRGINWQKLGLSALLVTGCIGIFSSVSRRVHRPLRRRDYIVLCLLSISTPLLVTFKIPYMDRNLPTNLPAVGFLVSSFYGSPLAITHVILLTGLTAFTDETINTALFAGAIGGLVAAAMAERLHSRDELAVLGSLVGVAQGGVYYITHLIMSAAAKTIWLSLLPDAIIYGLSGMAWSVIAIGLSPYLERLFDLVTPIRLIELSNPNCPLLKRLATEAPGTFQHTVLVACLAEAAARQLHCNVELVRAGTLYHDIGKMHDPLAFIENQMGGPNKHDQINEPWQSAEIIKKHVSEGLVMAKKYGLPRVIRDFIPEHQGTLLIAYFYYQAKELKGEKVSEADFRYAGPVPQSRETGIVMLADGCEAALRSLRDATPEIAKATIQKIFQARWRDGQLKDSGIRQEELKIIAEVFVQVWQQFHHQRIAYPKAALDRQEK